MEYKNITNEEFLKIPKEFEDESGKVLGFLICNDTNKNNQQIYNIILNKYSKCYKEDIRLLNHSYYEDPTGVFHVSGNVPAPLFAKMVKIYDRLQAEEKQKKIDEDLKRDPEAKAIYDKLEL